MKAQPETKWNVAKASILAVFALAVGGLAIALPTGVEAPTGSRADAHAGIATIRAEDEAPFIDDFLDASSVVHATRDPSLAGLRVAEDADPGGYDLETY
jgi:hypothetical protein